MVVKPPLVQGRLWPQIGPKMAAEHLM